MKFCRLSLMAKDWLSLLLNGDDSLLLLLLSCSTVGVTIEEDDGAKPNGHTGIQPNNQPLWSSPLLRTNIHHRFSHQICARAPVNAFRTRSVPVRRSMFEIHAPM
ncbi:hypothetical protein QYF36_012077 [Acer negundo]|nr:hypothetical protein QYF36_012077 [Acer negundo]